MAAVTEVSVPDLGDFADVPVIEIHVAPGDVVHNEDPLVTLESDKATMDVPSPAAGRPAGAARAGRGGPGGGGDRRPDRASPGLRRRARRPWGAPAGPRAE